MSYKSKYHYCFIPRKVVKGHNRHGSRCLHARHRVAVNVGSLRLAIIVIFSNSAVEARDCFPWDGQVVCEAFGVHDGSRDHTWPYIEEVKQRV